MPVPISLLEAFSVLPDPRLDRSKEHRWSELLVIAVCTMLTGGESFYDMEDTDDNADYDSNEESTLTTAGGAVFTVDVSTPGSVRFIISNTGSPLGNYYLAFTAPAGATLAVGDYPGAKDSREEDTTVPGLYFDNESLNGDYAGEFQILEIKFSPSGKLRRFAANFVEHQAPWELEAPLYGQIRYRSSVPYASPAGIAQLSDNHFHVLNSARALAVPVTRNDGGTGPLSVDYTTADGSDVAGRNYAATSGTLTWADGDTASKVINVPILQPGTVSAADNRFLVKLSGPGSGPQAQASVTILNDDSAVTRAHFISDQGDYIGQGQERYFSIANDFLFTAAGTASGVEITFSNHSFYTEIDSDWTLDVTPPKGGSLHVGDYENAESDFGLGDGRPGLSFSGESRGSNYATGSFQVLEAVFDAKGNVLKFAVDFVQHSEGGTPALTGQVRYHSTVPLPAPAPTTVQVSALIPYLIDHTDFPSVFTITRSGPISDPLVVSYEMIGTAVNGKDYVLLKGTRKIKAQKASAQVKLVPIPLGPYGHIVLDTVTATMRLLPQDNYGVTDHGEATVEIGQVGGD